MATAVMRALVYREYGSPERVLHVADVEQPGAGRSRALVRVQASTVNLDDLQYVRGEISVRPGGWRKPRYPILGSDIAGTVEAVGANVRRVRPGDEVIADLTTHGFGGFAEYVSVPARALHAKPPGLSFEEAACLPTAGLRALQALSTHGPLVPGRRVLINGAGGGLGTFAIQIAKAFGAHVTGVDGGAKLDHMRAAGADEVLDYSEGHFTERGDRFDLIVDVAAYGSPSDLRPIARARQALTDDGRYRMYMVGGGALDWVFTKVLLQSWMKLRGGWRLRVHRGVPNRAADMAVLAELVGTGAVRPVVDQTYPLAGVPAAMRYVEQGLARGKVVITI